MSFTRYQKNFMNTYPFSGINMNAQLAVSTALSWVVPGTPLQKFRVKFRSSFTDDIWVSYNGTAIAPTAGTSTTVSHQELIPLDECRYVVGGSTLSFISTTGTPQVSAQLLLVEDVTGM
jgi:hypothetical protein